MPYRPNIKNADGNLIDIPLEAETAVRLKMIRTIGLSGVSNVAQQFNGTSNIKIPISAIPAMLLTGTASINTTGTATKSDQIKVGDTYYQFRTTTDVTDPGLPGFITFIL